MDRSMQKEAGMKRGFTLIELLVVITILAILAGAALPYVQSYVLESRISKAKADLDEIGRSLTLYETRENTYNASDVSLLTGRYLNKAPIDPWGKAYAVSTAAGLVYSGGPDRNYSTQEDNLSFPYQPPLALVQCKWVDRNQTGAVDTQNSPDQVQLVFSRSLGNSIAQFEGLTINGNLEISSGTQLMSDAFNCAAGNPKVLASRTLVLDVLIDGAFTVGSDTIQVKTGNQLTDLSPSLNKALASQPVTILPQ